MGIHFACAAATDRITGLALFWVHKAKNRRFMVRFEPVALFYDFFFFQELLKYHSEIYL